MAGRGGGKKISELILYLESPRINAGLGSVDH